MAKDTKAGNSAQVKRLREALAREKVKSAALAKSRAEALEQQAAAAEILKVISRSPSNAQPVFDAIVKRALRLIRGHSAAVFRYADGLYHLGAYTSTTKSGDAALKKRYPRPLSVSLFHRRAIRTKTPFFVADTEKAPAHFRQLRKVGRARGYRSIVVVPLICGGAVIGGITVSRKEPGPFDSHHLDLLRTFADQAVIAIENVRLFNETKEALERQTATAEILRVISGSPTDIQPVLDAICKSAARLCSATDVLIRRLEGNVLRAVAHIGPIALPEEVVAPLLSPKHMAGRAVIERRTIHVHDVTAPEVLKEYPEALSRAQKGRGFKSLLIVPLIQNNRGIGLISIRRVEKRPFSEQQISLLQSFADQAVIAIENVRLFNETKEALERQTATAEILKVISSSPTDTQPVFDTISQSASRLCESEYSYVFRFDGNLIHLVAHAGSTGEFYEAMQRAWPRALNMGTAAGRAILTRSIAHVPDVHADPDYVLGPVATAAAYGSTVAVPMLRDGVPIGTINLSRSRAGAYSERQIDLLQTFADQAVIAIENVRLFNETKEALERQTATAEILKVIASSPSDVQPVFDAIAASAMRLMGGSSASVVQVVDDALHLAALTSTNVAGDEGLKKLFPAPISALHTYNIVITSRAPFVRSDTETDPSISPQGRELARARGYRSQVFVPMLRERDAIGAITVARPEPGGFSEHQIELIETFADQAVIAIENVRLFNETKEALDRQTATAEILKVMSASQTDVQPVLEAVAENAGRLCDAQDVSILESDGDVFRVAAFRGAEQLKLFDGTRVTRGSVAGRAILDGRLIQVDDITAEPEGEFAVSRAAASSADSKTMLATPLLRDGRSIGAIFLRRTEVRPFSAKQIELLRTFADQAAIAIENVRLFNETKEALERQTASSEILRVVARSVADAQPVFQAILASLLRLFAGFDATVWTVREGLLVSVVRGGATLDASVATKIPIAGEHPYAAALRDHRVLRLDDVTNARDISEAGRADLLGRNRKAVVLVPLLRDASALGALSVSRATPHAFTAAQLELLKNFADQATIAIENARLFNETKEALERQTATAEILKVIAGSPTDVQPVFDVIVQRAVQLCGARFGRVYRYDGSIIEMVAGQGLSTKGLRKVQQVFPRAASEDTIVGRVILTKQPFFVKDIERDDSVPELSRQMIAALDTRSQVTVPVLRGGEPIGAITMGWDAPNAFDDQKVELLQTFAAQAVIAIENVRLFNETNEALERQTAISEILRVMSDSPSDVLPVLDAVTERAMRICESRDARIFLVDGDKLRYTAGRGDVKSGEIGMTRPINRGLVLGRAVIDKVPVHVEDLAAVSDEEYPLGRQIQREFGHHTTLAVPLLREGNALGVILLRRNEVRSFTERQISLLQTFADQAAIAIENVRLFNETKEALDRQTATSEVLKTISRSTFDLNAVLQVLIENATRLAGANQGFIFRFDGEVARLACSYNAPAEYTALISANPIRPGRGALVARALLERRPVHIPDALEDKEFTWHEAQRLGGFRSMFGVPMMREGNLIGVIAIWRNEVLPFTEKQIELVSTFADQAVIAIENVRLFNETTEALERQTATSEVLNVIARSPSDVQPVLDAVAESAARLCGASDALIMTSEAGMLVRRAHFGPIQSVSAARPLTRGTPTGRAVLERCTVHIEDVLAEIERGDYLEAAELQRRNGMRTILSVPLVREDSVIGVISMRRLEVRPFTEKQIALVKTFADQAVIAIENARLFNETKESLERQTATAEILKVIAASPSDVQPVFDAIVTSAARLFGRRATLRIVEAGGTRRRARSEVAAADSPELIPIDDNSLAGRVILHATAMQVVDTLGPDAPPFAQANAHKWDFRANAAAPLTRDGKAIGSISVASPAPGAMSDKQMALLATFADQAVIAIENVRLFNETKEALDQQTATAGILGVISGSPTSVQPVFESILEHALPLCEANFGYVCTSDGNAFDHAVQRGLEDPVRAEAMKAFHETRVPGSNTALGRLRETKRSVHILDAREEPAYRARDPRRVAIVELAGARTMLAMPLLREGDVIGAVVIYRREVKAFTDKQTDLLRTFAAQAVIAIENVRLFNETKEALERQTATAEILQVMGSSPTDTQPVFDAIVNSGVRLFPGAMITVARPDGGSVRAAAIAHEDTTMVAGWRERFTTPLSRDRLHAAAILDAKLIDFPDAEAEKDGPLGPGVRNFLLSGNRAVTIMPMLRGDGAIGAISVTRAVPGPLSDKQIAILRTFADQAVIAIENVRLFNETKEALERQTATSEILGVIAGSPSDVQPVFDAIVQTAIRLVPPWNAAIDMRDGDVIRMRAAASPRVAQVSVTRFAEFFPMPFDPATNEIARCIAESRVVESADSQAPGMNELLRKLATAGRYRSAVLVPLVHKATGIGAIGLTHPEPNMRLSDKQMELISTFANQAVIAIENVRLFNETKEALERQTATAEILKVIASSPSDVQPVFDAIVNSVSRLFGRKAALRTVEPEGLRRRARSYEPMPGEFHGPDVEPLDQSAIVGQAILGRRALQWADTLVEGAATYGMEKAKALAFRSIASAPLIRHEKAIGVISVSSPQPGTLSDKQMELLSTFADQAVIAIENARLFNETKESLERQTATAEILKVIASSPSDVQPVFDAIAASARRLLGGDAALVARRAGDVLELAAFTSTGQAGDSEISRLWPAKITGKGHMGKAVVSAAPAWLEDIETDLSYSEEFRAGARARGMRSAVSVPMLREGEAIGVISVNRSIPGRFSDHQTNLLKTFADQALIAIENVRLFNELQTRTEALTKSVGQLTALGEVGQAISSTLDLEKVLKTIATHAVQLTGLDGASIYEYDEAAAEFRLQVAHNFDPGFLEAIRNAPIRKGDGTVGGVAITLEPAQVTDVLEDSYHSSRKELLTRAGYRAVLTVPLLREDHIIGALSVTRKTPGPFAEEIVELLKTFATQSAMAIQNARLFREIAEKGKQLEEASKHKSQFLASMSHELRTPLNAILGFNEMILGDIYGEVPADMKEPLTDIQTSGKHLLRLINNVLDLAKIEAGRMELALDDYSVHDTVESVRSTLRPLAEAKGLELAVDVPSDIPLARGDGGRITQCLMNLAGNSLKFTKQGSVGISVALNNGTLTYCVRDTGIGIPADKIGSLFTEFKQTDATIASEYGGTGLGLSISKKFIEMHGGRIWAESEPGTGSTFIFEVPLRAGEASEA